MRYIIILFMILLSGSLLAQTDSTATGEVVDAEIIIEKDKKIVLPQADKISTPVEIKNFNLARLELSYEALEPDFNFPEYKSDISFVELKERYPIATFQNYVQAGYGNFQSPLLGMGFFHQLGSTKLGAKVFHESFGSGPIGDKNSASSFSSLDLSARYKNEILEIVPQINYARTGYRFYGNTDRINSGFSTESPEEGVNGSFGVGVNLRGKMKGLNYYFSPKVISMAQSLTDGDAINQEAGVEIVAGFDLEIDKKISAGIDSEGYSTSYTGGLEYGRSLFSLRPTVTITTEKLKLSAGFTFASGKVDNSSESGIYPFLDGSFAFSSKWSLYAAWDGGMRWNSLNDLLNDNLFLDDSLNILNTKVSTSFSGGIKGNPINSVRVKTGFVVENFEDLPFYVPAAADSSRFSLVYDGGTTTRFTFLGDIAIVVNPNTVLGANLQLFSYSLNNLEKAWHFPGYSFSIYFSQNIQNKLLVSANIIAEGGIVAPVITTASEMTLDSFADLNLSATYRVTDRLSAFLKGNNLLNNQYEKLIGYPVRGATFKLGASYRF